MMQQTPVLQLQNKQRKKGGKYWSRKLRFSFGGDIVAG